MTCQAELVEVKWSPPASGRESQIQNCHAEPVSAS
jgi:hypothetical protein